MKISTVSKILCTAVFGVAASVSVMAATETYNETVVYTSAEGIRTASVSYADLDLNTAKARDTLHYRISNAARQVCGRIDRNGAGSLDQVSKNRSCYSGAMSDAMRTLSNGQVAVVSR